MRLVWRLDAGCPWPLCNAPVFDLAGELLGVPDLIDPVHGVYGEYDGAAAPRREAAGEGPRPRGRVPRPRPRGRHDARRRPPRSEPASSPACTQAYERAAALPAIGAGRGRSTSHSWWRDTSTVDARRSLDDVLADSAARSPGGVSDGRRGSP